MITFIADTLKTILLTEKAISRVLNMRLSLPLTSIYNVSKVLTNEARIHKGEF